MAVVIILRLMSMTMCYRRLVGHAGHLRGGVARVSAAAALQTAGKVVDEVRQDAGQLRNLVDRREVASNLGHTRCEPSFVAPSQRATSIYNINRRHTREYASTKSPL